MAQSWSPQSWREKPARQMPDYADQKALEAVETRLKTHPPAGWRPRRILPWG
ncbi:MAG: 3-deoxy-7-phosphoheptulonate synthase, partial [Alphaproteobacteria bacterium]|nr:3-deoxy-7-phosphoheptulonate synthase [Alphaproteobacteria bacterium]